MRTPLPGTRSLPGVPVKAPQAAQRPAPLQTPEGCRRRESPRPASGVACAACWDRRGRLPASGVSGAGFRARLGGRPGALPREVSCVTLRSAGCHLAGVLKPRLLSAQ